MKSRSTNFLLTLILLLYIALFYGLPLQEGMAYYSADTSGLNYTVLRDYTSELKSGEYNLWEPGVFLGIYRAADPVLGLYSPRLIFYFLFQDYSAQTACLFYFFIVAGLGAFMLGLSITRNRSAALFMGIVYSSSGFIASMHVNIPYLSAAWLPWVFWSYLNFREGRGRGWLITFFIAMIGLEGDIIGCFITIACLWVFFIIDPHPFKQRVREAGGLALASILAPALLAIILIPALGVMEESRRGLAIPYDMATHFSLHPARLVNLLAPGLWGEYFNQSFRGQHLTSSLFDERFWMESIYIGLIPLVCIGLAVFGRDSRTSIRAPLFLALVMLALSFGKYTPIYELAYKVIPGVDRFRYPAKLYAWASFFLIWCSAVGFEKLSGIFQAEKGKIWRAARNIFIFFSISLIAIYVYTLSSRQLAGNPSDNLYQYLFILRRDVIRLVLAATVIPLFMLMKKGDGILSRLIPSALIALTILDLAFASPCFSLKPGETLDNSSATARFIADLPEGRLLKPRYIENYCPQGPRASLKHNWGLIEGVEYALGYVPTVPRRFDPIVGDNFFPDFEPLARVMAIRYVINSIRPSVREVRELDNKGILSVEKIFRDENLALLSIVDQHSPFMVTREIKWAPSAEEALDMVLHERAGPVILEKQEAFFEGKPISPAPDMKAVMKSGHGFSEILKARRASGDEIEVNAELDRPGILVVRERLGRGWNARVNGEPQVIYRADYFGAAIELPEGSSHVRFYFSPGGYYIGVLVTVLSLVLLLGWMLLSERSARKSP